jgi:preprotein translocase subunit SecD
MTLCNCLVTTVVLLGSQVTEAGLPQQTEPAFHKKLPTGVYVVERASFQEKAVLPLHAAEVLLVDHHRYLKNDDKEPSQFLVVHQTPEVPLDLAGEPKAEKELGEVVRVLLRLKPSAAKALERLTRERPGRQLAIVVDGEVVTVHKIRTVLTHGEVQITSCSPGGAAFLLKQLQTLEKKR